MKLHFVSVLAALTFCVGVAEAQVSRAPSQEEIMRQLAGSPVKTVSRGVRVEEAPVQEQPKSIDLDINFEHNSMKLTQDAKKVLDNLGAALQSSALASARFQIVGHTDAKGQDTYNQKLSRQRAQAVADYLSKQYAIASKRLAVQGMGSKQLLDPTQPESPVNRRVQVINLGA